MNEMTNGMSVLLAWSLQIYVRGVSAMKSTLGQLISMAPQHSLTSTKRQMAALLSLPPLALLHSPVLPSPSLRTVATCVM